MSRVKSKSKFYTAKRPPPKKRFGFRGKSVIFALSIMIAFAGILSWRVGWPQRQWARAADAALGMTARAGFALKDVVLAGRENLDVEEVEEALQIRVGMPIFAVDLDAALARLEKLPWLRGATIARRLPDTLYVRLMEKKPLARWQHRSRIYVIDRDGAPIMSASAHDFARLPLVVGDGAAEQALDLLLALKAYPEIRAVMRAAARVGGRRWNLALAPGVTVLLPEEEQGEALKRLADLIAAQRILDRAIKTVDLRLPDSMALDPLPGSAQARASSAPRT